VHADIPGYAHDLLLRLVKLVGRRKLLFQVSALLFRQPIRQPIEPFVNRFLLDLLLDVPPLVEQRNNCLIFDRLADRVRRLDQSTKSVDGVFFLFHHWRTGKGDEAGVR